MEPGLAGAADARGSGGRAAAEPAPGGVQAGARGSGLPEAPTALESSAATLSRFCSGLPPRLSVFQARGAVLCGWDALARGLVLSGLRTGQQPCGLGPVEAA